MDFGNLRKKYKNTMVMKAKCESESFNYMNVQLNQSITQIHCQAVVSCIRIGLISLSEYQMTTIKECGKIKCQKKNVALVGTVEMIDHNFGHSCAVLTHWPPLILKMPHKEWDADCINGLCYCQNELKECKNTRAVQKNIGRKNAEPVEYELN